MLGARAATSEGCCCSSIAAAVAYWPGRWSVATVAAVAAMLEEIGCDAGTRAPQEWEAVLDEVEDRLAAAVAEVGSVAPPSRERVASR